MDLPGGATQADAQPGRRLGRGGFGVVTEEDRDGVPVAVKRLRPERADDPERRARLRREAQVLGRLSHRYIPRLLGFTDGDQGPVLEMEFIDGAPLGPRLRGGPLPVPLAVRLGAQLAEALAHAHEHGVIHRDVKPDNVMLVTGEDGEEVRLLDFGVAKVNRESQGPHTRVETGDGALGTLQYMAPEQVLAAGSVDGQADVFSLGVVLYEVLTGAPPFGRELAHWSATRPAVAAPDEHNSLVPQWLARLVLAMLAADPKRRPTMAQVALALAPLPRGDCPFPGLGAFAEDQAGVFYGRQREVHEARARLGQRRWLLIEGASGSGKSSLLRAGLVPALRAEGEAVLVLRPGREPLLNLAQALAFYSPSLGAFAGVLATLRGPTGLRDLLRHAAPPGGRVMLVLDAFDEALLAPPDDLAAFDRALDEALGDADGPLHLVTALRSDRVGGMARLPRLEKRLNQAERYYLPPMERAGLREALLGPCARAGLHCEPELVARVLADTDGQVGSLPLLGHALRSLYEDRAGDTLTLASYERLGGVAGALAQDTEALLESLGSAGRERARRILVSLVRLGRDTAEAARPRSRGDVLAAAGGDALADAILRQLLGERAEDAPVGAPARARLLIQSGDRVELIHEALLRYMPALKTWIEEDRRLLERRDDVEQAAAQWQAMGCPRDALAEGAALTFYEGVGLPTEAQARLRELVKPEARRFLHESRRRQRVRTCLRGLVAVVMVVLAVIAGVEWYLAESRLGDMRDFLQTSFGQNEQDIVRSHAPAQIAKEFYEDGLKRAESQSEALDFDKRLVTASLHRRLGDLALELNQRAEAEEHFREVEKRLGRENDKKSRIVRAEALWRLGDLFYLTRRMEALDLLQRAEELLKLAEPKEENLGFLYYVWGKLTLQDGDREGSAEWLGRAETLQRELVEENKGTAWEGGYLWHLGRILMLQASLHAQERDTAAAQRNCREALGLLEQAATKDPHNRFYKRDLAEARAAASTYGVQAQVGTSGG